MIRQCAYDSIRFFMICSPIRQKGAASIGDVPRSSVKTLHQIVSPRQVATRMPLRAISSQVCVEEGTRLYNLANKNLDSALEDDTIVALDLEMAMSVSDNLLRLKSWRWEAESEDAMQREGVLRMLHQLAHLSGSIVEEMWPEADARASVVRYVRCE